MPRHGQNPQRWKTSLRAPPAVTAGTVVHLPVLDGYWAEGLDVLRLCLDTLRATLPADAEIAVVDNASCADVRGELGRRFEDGRIDRLLLSRRNLGKVGAWNHLFAASPSEMVAYCDSDVYFLPGWFEATRRVLDAFPEAAMVTAQPIPGDLSRDCRATLDGAAASPDVELREGVDLIPEPYVDSHRRGLGETPERYARRLANRRDVLLRRGDTAAYVSASHFQFVLRRSAAERFFPMPTSVPLGDDAAFDAALDAAGLWRLSTVDYLVHHLGNRLPDLAAELPWAELDATPPRPSKPSPGWTARLARRTRVRRFLKGVHRRVFDLLYPDEG